MWSGGGRQEEGRKQGKREGERENIIFFFLPLPYTQKPQVKTWRPLHIKALLQITKTTALPPSIFVAKQFVGEKGWNLDIPFSCLRNLRTLTLWDFRSMELMNGDVQHSPLSNQQVQWACKSIEKNGTG